MYIINYFVIFKTLAITSDTTIFDYTGGKVMELTSNSENKEPQRDLFNIQKYLLNLSNEAIFAWELNGGIIYWNKGAELMYGYTSDEVSGCISHILLKTIHPCSINNIELVLYKDGFWNGEVEHTCKDGRKLNIETRKQVIINESGQQIVLECNRDITERKSMEMKLIEAKSFAEAQAKQLKIVMDNITEGIIVADEKGNMISMNPAALRMHGISSLEEFKHYKHFSSCIKTFNLEGKPIEPEEWPMGKALRGETFTDYEMWVYHKDINLPWIGSYGGTPIYNENGEMIMAIISLRDITKQRLDEETLRESELHLRVANEGAALGTYIYNFTTGEDQWSPQLKELWGIKVENYPLLDEDKLYVGLHPEDKQKILTAMTTANNPSSDGVLLLDYRIIRPDGCVRWLHVHGQTEFIGEGQNRVPWRAAGAVIDITERKRMEEKLNTQKRQIEVIIENMPDAFVFYNKEGQIILLNAEARRLYPHLDSHMTTREIHRGFKYYDLNNNIIPKEKLPTNRALKGEYIRNERIIIERSNRQQITEINATPVFDDNNNLISIAVSHRDVTDFVKSQEEIKFHHEQLLHAEKVKNEALEDAIKLKDEFFYLITHEFKTPMTVINVAMQAIEYSCKEEVTEKVGKYLSTIKLNVNRQIRLVNNLLDIVRINSGHLKLDNSYFDVVKVLDTIINSVQLYAEQKNVKLGFHTKLSSSNIYSDEEKLERIMLNLLSNALKFTPNGKSITVTLGTKKRRNTKFILIKVQDEGVGIPQDKQELIFERFGQVDNSLSRQAEGTGLGLHLVKLLVNSVGGEISLESEVDKGSTFTLLLPAAISAVLSDADTLKETSNQFFSNDSRIIQSTEIEFSDLYI